MHRGSHFSLPQVRPPETKRAQVPQPVQGRVHERQRGEELAQLKEHMEGCQHLLGGAVVEGAAPSCERGHAGPRVHLVVESGARGAGSAPSLQMVARASVLESATQELINKHGLTSRKATTAAADMLRMYSEW